MNKNSIIVSINGVGWNVKQTDVKNTKELVFNVGFAHPVKVIVPNYINIEVQSNVQSDVKLNVSYKSTDEIVNDMKQREKVGDFVASLMRIRPWNIYTGQGIVRMDRTDNLIRRRGKRK